MSTLKQNIGFAMICLSFSGITSFVTGHFMMVSQYEEVNRQMDDMRIKAIGILIVTLIIGVYLLKPHPDEQEQE